MDVTEFGAGRTSVVDRASGSRSGPPTNAAERLRASPPLVFADECDLLAERLAEAARGEAQVLWGADRPWSPAGLTAEAVEARLRTFLQTAAVLMYAASLPVVKIDRVDPHRCGGRHASAAMCQYEGAAARLNLLRALATGGCADLRRVNQLNREFVNASAARSRCAGLVDEIDRALAFMHACGKDPAELTAVEFFAAHEARSPVCESALTRVDSRTGCPYDAWGHVIWVRRVDSACVDHLASVRNPLGVRLTAGTGPDETRELLARIDPGRTPGRATLLVRMDVQALRDTLPAIVEKVTAEQHQVVWTWAPAPLGRESRRFDSLLAEATAFFEVHRALGTHPGGMTADLAVDPADALELAFYVAELLRTS